MTNEQNQNTGLATPETASKPANIKFAGRDEYDKKKRKVIREAYPLEKISDRGEIITLPPAAEQKSRRLFYHPDADRIVQMFPHLYKSVK